MSQSQITKEGLKICKLLDVPTTPKSKVNERINKAMRKLRTSKSKKDESHKKTLTEIIGHSPDEADAYVLMRCARRHPQRKKLVPRVW